MIQLQLCFFAPWQRQLVTFVTKKGKNGRNGVLFAIDQWLSVVLAESHMATHCNLLIT